MEMRFPGAKIGKAAVEIAPGTLKLPVTETHAARPDISTSSLKDKTSIGRVTLSQVWTSGVLEAFNNVTT